MAYEATRTSTTVRTDVAKDIQVYAVQDDNASTSATACAAHNKHHTHIRMVSASSQAPTSRRRGAVRHYL